MIKKFRNLLLLFAAVFALVLVSCSEDDGGTGTLPDDVAGTLEGTWTGGSATLNSLTIDGDDFSTFVEELRQFLIDSEIPEDQVDGIIAEFEDGFSEESFEETFEGSLTFDPDGTYELTDTDGTETGTWELADNDQTLVLDSGTEDELSLSIVSLTSTRFEGLLEEQVMEELLEEGTTSEIAVSVTFTFTR